MRAVDALMECLKAEGVDVVFGLPGGANLPTYDAFYDAGIRHILVRHEAGGGHAAEGYAKATGKVGVSIGTSGPGATNLVTPICDAMMDSVPVVFLTGHAPPPGGNYARRRITAASEATATSGNSSSSPQRVQSASCSLITLPQLGHCRRSSVLSLR